MMRFIRIVLLAALLAGTLDAGGAVINYSLNGGKDPAVIFRYIASAVFGRAAYTGGTNMVIWGVVLHYAIALGFTIAFFLLYPRMAILSDNRWLAGVFYGIAVWMVMNLVVVPMSHARKFPFRVTGALIAMGILILAIGIPISLMAHYYYDYTEKPRIRA
ncbi:MAG: hypothetical protein Q8932_09140 [Bacteroidota bacterium]|nr:hypothetical protein [Bacteroidota bacterium]